MSLAVRPTPSLDMRLCSDPVRHKISVSDYSSDQEQRLLEALKEQQQKHAEKIDRMLSDHTRSVVEAVTQTIDQHMGGGQVRSSELNTKTVDAGLFNTCESASPIARNTEKKATLSNSVQVVTPRTEATPSITTKPEKERSPTGRPGRQTMVMKAMTQALGQNDPLAATGAVRKLNRGAANEITLAEMEELTKRMGTDDDGLLELTKVQDLLVRVIEPPCSLEDSSLLIPLIDFDESGLISSSELLAAFQFGPLAHFIQTKQKHHGHKKNFADKMGFSVPITREFMLERFQWRVDRDDAFKTLPFSLFYAMIFIVLVVYHLDTTNRHRMEHAIEEWVKDYGATLNGPFLEEHVGYAPQARDWLRDSGLPSVLGDCFYEPTGDICLVASRNTLLGDIRVTWGESETWLLDSHVRTTFFTKASNRTYLETANDRFSEAYFYGPKKVPGTIRLTFYLYADATNQLTEVNIASIINDRGHVRNSVRAKTVPLSVYDSKFILAIDMLYCIFLLRLTYGECKDLLKAICFYGCSRFGEFMTDYWSVWNVADWISISLGIANSVNWIWLCIAVQDKVLRSLIEQDSVGMDLDTATIEHVSDQHGYIVNLYLYLKALLSLNMVSITMKFFKAFQANPRLHVVTGTLFKAANEIFHFWVVFVVVFMSYVSVGHILFGQDRLEFVDLSASINTCFYTLFGEFGWYLDATEFESEEQYNKVPKVLYMIWFVTFMIFVLMVLLNMLLAIVLDHYTELMHEIRHAKHEWARRPIWSQTWNYLKRLKNSYGEIPLTNVIYAMQKNVDEDEIRITEETFAMACPNMKEQQATHLMQWLQAEAAAMMDLEEDDKVTARLKMIETHLDTMFEHQLKTDLKIEEMLNTVGSAAAAAPKGRKSMSAR